MNTKISERKYEFDWLRIMAILVVFLYHSSRFFNLENWHVKNINTYAWVEGWNYFATLWMMPLFFIISGASLFFALQKANRFRQFYSDKFSRLMIPVLFATITHSALQVYLERISHGQFTGSFPAFFPGYFSGLYLEIGGAGNFAFHGMHLWYLLFLFFYSLLCYPIFEWLTDKGYRFLKRITSLFAIPGLIYLWFTLPMLILKWVIPNSVLSVGNGGWGFLYYLWFLIAGFMIASSDGLTLLIRRQRLVSLALAVILTAFYLYQCFSPAGVIFPIRINSWINALLRYASAWCCLFAILGFGTRYLSVDRPILRHLNEGVLPFYILHQTVLLWLGYYIMTMDIHDGLKWVIVFSGSFIMIICIYILAIRKIDLLRFLFGMKTAYPFFTKLKKRTPLFILHLFYFGLIAFAVIDPFPGFNSNRSPAPISYDHKRDIVLDNRSIINQSTTGVKLIKDEKNSQGQAIAFLSGAVSKPASVPEVFVDMQFSAPAGSYVAWLRGTSNTDDVTTDSIWLQVDKQIGTQKGRMLGNWLNIHPAGTWAWASDGSKPVAFLLMHTGDHTIRIQPRQTPHQLDQIWLSRFQHRIPDTGAPIK